ncbi:MAG TPA: RNA methyltransferase [Nitrosospira sp.]|nr:RNA methyltransferase [Nitrosospira sp.]
MKFITSRDNAFFKQLIKLAGSTKERKAAGLTLLDGIHLISAYHCVLGQPESLVVSQSGNADPEIKRLLVEQGTGSHVKVIMLSDNLFREISPVKTPTGIMALVAIPSPPAMSPREDQAGEPFYVLLEAIQDPGNLGSILRSAAAAAATDVYLSKGCADAWSPKTLRAAMGAHFLLHIHEQSDLADVARSFNGRVIATSLRAETSLYRIALRGPVAFVFGSEGMGLSDALLQASSEQISIPMPGGTESLNAAAAAAICFFEKVRQSTTSLHPIT